MNALDDAERWCVDCYLRSPMRYLRYWFFLLPLAVWAQGSNGVITTIAGNGVAAYSGDGGPAISASLAFAPTRQEPGQPNPDDLDQYMHLSVDQAGNLWFADGANQRIRKITLSGVISTIVGSGVRRSEERRVGKECRL